MVEVQHLNQRPVGDFHALLQRNQVHTRLVVLVNNLELEVVALKLRGVQGIDVFHHQIPGRRVLGAQVGVTRVAVGIGHAHAGVAGPQHLKKHHLLGAKVAVVGRCFAHLVGLAVVEVGIAHAQHLVGQQGRVEGNVAKLRVVGEFAGVELAGAHPLEVHVLGQALRALQEIVNAEVVAGRGPGPNQGSKLGVGVVAGRSLGGGGTIGNVLLLVEA